MSNTDFLWFWRLIFRPKEGRTCFAGSGWRRGCVCEVQRDAAEQETAEVKTASLSLTAHFHIHIQNSLFPCLGFQAAQTETSRELLQTGQSTKHPQIRVKNRRYFIMNQQRSWQKPAQKSTLQPLCDFINVICTRYTVSEQFHLISNLQASKITRKEGKTIYLYRKYCI